MVRIEHIIDAGKAPFMLLHDRQEPIDYLPELLSFIECEEYSTKSLMEEMQPVTFHCEMDWIHIVLL